MTDLDRAHDKLIAVRAATDTDARFDALYQAVCRMWDHLEAQPTTTADYDPTANHPRCADGDEAVQAAMAVLCDEGADSEGGWHSWRCFDRERYPEPCGCTEQVARAAIAAAEPHIRAKTLAPIRAALANHPRCDIHPDDDSITCGWKRAVASVQAALDKEDR